MRGWDLRSEVLFSYVNCEQRVPKDHPLRAILRFVDQALATLSPEFERLYARFGRPSIAPERLLRALLLQAFYSVRSELSRDNLGKAAATIRMRRMSRRWHDCGGCLPGQEGGIGSAG